MCCVLSVITKGLVRGTRGGFRGLIPVALRSQPSTLHPHLGTTLWIDRPRPVDGSSEVGGQPVFIRGTAGVIGASSTGTTMCPPQLPRRSPQLAMPIDVRGSAPSTLHTGPSTAAGELSIDNPEINRGVDEGTAPPGPKYPWGGMAPSSPRLYGEFPCPGLPGRSTTAPERRTDTDLPVPRRRSGEFVHRHRQRERSPS
jgi:hypothetical protein